MIKLHMSLYEQCIEPGGYIRSQNKNSAIWIRNGLIFSGEKTLKTGDGFYLGKNTIPPVRDQCKILCFNVTKIPTEPPVGENMRILLRSTFEWPNHEAVLRLDQVTFPGGTGAYRHIHAGAGIRYLTMGQLKICSDHHAENMNPDDAWFEDARSPVEAIASTKETTQFVRALVIPTQYKGKPTIEYLDSNDAQKPKLQTNHRFFDQTISF